MDETTDPVGTPPVTPDEAALEAGPSRWPTAIGVISLIYAIGGLLCQVVGAAWVLFLAGLVVGMTGFEMTLPPAVKVTTIVLVVLNTILGVMMLVGAAGLLRRQRSGVSMLKKWAVGRIATVLLGLVLAIVTLPHQVEMQRSVQEFQNEQLREAGQSSRIVEKSDDQLAFEVIRGALIGSGVMLVYPVFVGFYLSRRKVDEELRDWE